jgi:hypothetical protein
MNSKDTDTVNRILWLVVTGVVFTIVSAIIQLVAPSYFIKDTSVEVTCKCDYPNTKGDAQSTNEDEQ